MEQYNIELDKYINEILDDKDNVVGEIYLITNKINGKLYVGQTLSHRMNHKRYRPFGFLKRFDDHCSAARTSSKKTQYITNAIRKYGEDSFEVHLIKRCSREELDTYEQLYIQKFNTLYPDGYNLTTGGKQTVYIPVKKIGVDITYEFIKQHRDHQSQETKGKISQSLKEFYKNENNIDSLKQRGIQQHDTNRLKKFEGFTIKDNDICKYLSKKNNKDCVTYILKINGKSTTFHGKKSQEKEIKQRAYNFFSTLQQHDQIAGNP